LQKSTTLYLGNNRLSIRLPIELWRQLGKYSLSAKAKGNTLIVNLLIKHYGLDDLTEIHSKLISAKYDPAQSQSANTIVVKLLTQYFTSNPV